MDGRSDRQDRLGQDRTGHTIQWTSEGDLTSISAHACLYTLIWTDGGRTEWMGRKCE